MLGETWTQACAQAPILVGLGLHHGELIGRSHAEAFEATMTAVQELIPLLLAPRVADEWSDYARDFGQRWLLFSKRCASAATPASRATRKASSRSSPSTTTSSSTAASSTARSITRWCALIRRKGRCRPRTTARPWVIIDPRAGHGSGIGGFKSESEVGVALRYGHPVYFVIFFPDPEPGQTLADVTRGGSRVPAGGPGPPSRAARSRLSPATARAAGRA